MGNLAKRYASKAVPVLGKGSGDICHDPCDGNGKCGSISCLFRIGVSEVRLPVWHVFTHSIFPNKRPIGHTPRHALGLEVRAYSNAHVV